MSKLLPGGVNPDEFAYIRNRMDTSVREKALADAGILAIRSPEGNEEMCRVMRAPVERIPEDMIKGCWENDTYFIPGSRLYIKFNWSSVHVGQVVVSNVTNDYADPKYKVTIPIEGQGVYLNYWYNLLVSKNGIYLVNGEPDFGRGKTFDEYPMTELRFEFPLWMFPDTSKGKLPV